MIVHKMYYVCDGCREVQESHAIGKTPEGWYDINGIGHVCGECFATFRDKLAALLPILGVTLHYDCEEAKVGEGGRIQTTDGYVEPYNVVLLKRLRENGKSA